jgi:transcriptional regulator with XRE-family HTH domain
MEIWKDVPGYEGFYTVSNEGRVKRLAGSPFCHNDRILKTAINRTGYVKIALARGGKFWHTMVHRLVALAFIGDPPEGLNQVNHIDGNKLNNRPENLEWTNATGNSLHAIRLGLRVMPSGERAPAAILTNEQVIEIRKQYANGVRAAVLAAQYGVTAQYIGSLARGESRRHQPKIDLSERGKTHGKLTLQDAREIRRARRDGAMLRELASKYGVSLASIWQITSGRVHVDPRGDGG